MLVYLVRHGIADRRASSDAERELTPEGIAQNRAVVKKFFLQSPLLDKGFVSPYERAKQTAADFKLAFPSIEFEESPLITPDSDPYDVLNLLEENQDEHVILVGHNPLMSHLVSLLVDGTMETSRQVDTSNVLCVMMDIVAPGCGELKYVLEP
ncbi:MAG: phosphohistidine phosphatase SixA [Pseudomonadales bacterium]|nr:phosphohistidine phosphatase SixA [Pseudomonadales bacterium]